MSSPTIRVLAYRPGAPAEALDVEHTLPALQALVGGNLEMVRLRGDAVRFLGTGQLEAYSLRPPLVLVCNEDGHDMGAPRNRCGIVGPFFVARAAGSELVSLTDADIAAARHLLGD